jgi:hypothetical protein
MPVTGIPRVDDKKGEAYSPGPLQAIACAGVYVV